MTRDEFNKLPAAMQLRVLARVVFEREALADINVGKKPLPPKFDLRIFRQSGFQWASETSLEGICFWHAKAAQGAASGSQWAAKDAKRAKDLERWMAWREWFPSEQWQGERNDNSVTGSPPADRPRVYQLEQRNESNGGGGRNQQSAPPPEEDDGGVGFA